MMLIGAFLVFMWYHKDSNEMGYKRSTILNIMVVGVGIIALPYYFFRSRGVRGGAIYTAYFIATFIVWGVTLSVGILTVEYLIQS